MHAAFLFAFVKLGADHVAHIPVPALAGVTAYVGICLLEWGAWHRLSKMRRTDAAAFGLTAVSVLVANAVAAVAIGCPMYVLPWAYRRFVASVAMETASVEAVE